jgi:hypothetical protein
MEVLMKIEGSYPGQFINVVFDSLSDFPSDLNIGEIFRAQVLEVFSNEIVFRTPGGTTFKAVSKVNINAGKGDLIEFLVREKNGKQVFLERITHDRRGSTQKKELLDTKYIDVQIDKINNFQKDAGFISGANKYGPFVQLPLDRWNNEVPGELYILKRNKKKSNMNMENTILFISLNTKNLGTIETLVQVDKHDIKMTINVKSKEILEFVKKNQNQLCKSLSDIGYRMLGIRYNLTNENSGILPLQEKIAIMLDMGKISIDIRV